MADAISATRPVRVCCPFDPSIDHDKSNLDRYFFERDERWIVEAEGKRVCWFHLRRLTRKRVLEIDQAATSEKQALILAFRESVVRVDNLPMPDGTVEETWLPAWSTCDPSTVKRRVLNDEEIELFTREEIYDIGQVAWVISNLRPGMQAFCVPLDTSVHAMVATRRRLADASPAPASRDSAQPCSVSTPTPPTPPQSEQP